MLTPSFFMITGIILGLISLRTLIVVVRSWRELFDNHFTAKDRQQLSEAAIFLLLPISVLLHEAGHAVAVKAFGATITDFGWYFFYGFVGYEGFLTADSVFWIALAGNLVSVVLGLVAIAIPVVWPRRPTVNYLLFFFGAITLLNALVFYPALDLIGGVVGDWSQIYNGETPVLSAVTAVVHVGLLLGALLAWRSEQGRALFAVRTGLRSDAMRRVSRKQAATELLEIGESLAANWRHPLRVVTEAPDGAAGITLRWISNGYGRAVSAYAVVEGPKHIEVYGGIQQLDGTSQGFQRPIALIEGIPSPDTVTPAIIQALNTVDDWDMRAVEQAI